jgi:hypothetical protein
MPSQLLERLKLLFFGFPANPQQQQRRPELFGASIQWRQQQEERWQQQEQQQGLGGLISQPAVAVVAVEEEQQGRVLQEQQQSQLEKRVLSSLSACTSTESSDSSSRSECCCTESSSSSRQGLREWEEREELELHEHNHHWQQQQQERLPGVDLVDPDLGMQGVSSPPAGAIPGTSSVSSAAAAEPPSAAETLLLVAEASASLGVVDANNPSVVVLGSSSSEGSLASVVPLVGALSQQNGVREMEPTTQGEGELGVMSDAEVHRQWQQLQLKRRKKGQGIRVPVSAVAGGSEGAEGAVLEGAVVLQKSEAVPAAVVATSNVNTTAWTAGSGLYGWRSSR